MKKSVSFLLFACFIVFSACTTSSPEALQRIEDGVVVAEVKQGDINSVMSGEKLMSVVRGAFLKNDAARPVLEQAWVEGSGDYYYLIADGIYPDGNDKKVALELREVQKGKRTFLVLSN